MVQLQIQIQLQQRRFWNAVAPEQLPGNCSFYGCACVVESSGSEKSDSSSTADFYIHRTSKSNSQKI